MCDFLIERSILFDVRLNPIDFRVYCFLISQMNKETGTCKLSYKIIFSSIGTSRASVWRSVKHLKKLKLIKVKRLSNCSLYTLHTQSKHTMSTVRKEI